MQNKKSKKETDTAEVGIFGNYSSGTISNRIRRKVSGSGHERQRSFVTEGSLSFFGIQSRVAALGGLILKHIFVDKAGDKITVRKYRLEKQSLRERERSCLRGQ